MTVIAVCSVKHSPGATTLALALACAATEADRPIPLVVEADPAGGDLAAHLGLPVSPGLLGLAAAFRHQGSRPDVYAHAQPLPAGGCGVLGPLDAIQAHGAVDTLADRLPAALMHATAMSVIDCGRWSLPSPVALVLRSVDVTLLVLRPDVAGIEHARSQAPPLRMATAGRLGVVLVGERPYTAAEVKATLGLPVLGVIPHDARSVDALRGATGAKVARRSALVRAARSLIDRVEPIAAAQRDIAGAVR